MLALPMGHPLLQRFFELEPTIRGAMPAEGGHLIAAAVLASAERVPAGDLLEIGVLEGRSLLPAAAVRRRGEYVVAVDPFEGLGDEPALRAGGSAKRAAFEANWGRVLAGATGGLQVHRQGSDAFGPAARAAGRRFRYVSVDGDHGVEATRRDLELASDLLLGGGVISLDDVFNAEWPSVGQAAAAFLDGHPDLRAFAAGWNRLMICGRADVTHYQDRVEALLQAADPPIRPALKVTNSFPCHGVRLRVFTHRWAPASLPALGPAGYAAGAAVQRLGTRRPRLAAALGWGLRRLSPPDPREERA